VIDTDVIRSATPDDVPGIVAMVHELAEYEREPQSCLLTEAQLTAALFGPAPALFGHVAFVDDAAAGFALWFVNFSTWRGLHGIYLEDLFVRPRFRGHGLGRALLARLAAECTEHGYGRLEWSVLNWNEPSIGFYRALGAISMDEWTTFRLDGRALTALASTAPSPTPGIAH
jgi:GNAT superfamily N-acetyltransferase